MSFPVLECLNSYFTVCLYIARKLHTGHIFKIGHFVPKMWDCTRVSNGTGQCNFSGQQDRQIVFCPGTKGQRDKLKTLPRDGTGRDSQNSGRGEPGRAGTAEIRDGTRDKMGQSRRGHSKKGKQCSKTQVTHFLNLDILPIKYAKCAIAHNTHITRRSNTGL